MVAHHFDLIKEKVYSIIQCKTLDFCEIVELTDGAYPTDVLDALNYLIKDKVIEVVGSKYSLYNSKSTNKVNTIEVIGEDENKWIERKLVNLSDPHPADYDWRFTIDTVRKIIDKLEENDADSRVALFGTTTLFPPLKEKHKRVALFNKSKALIEDLRSMGYKDGLFEHDLFKPLFINEKFNCVVADPPWYLEFYRAFIVQASAVLDVGGFLFLSVLPSLTRPGAKDDQAKIIEFCIDSGFEKIDSYNSFLTYSSPKFEQQSLQNSGIHCSNWRKGDLYVFVKKKEVNSKTIVEATNDEPLWHEVNINKNRLKLRNKEIYDNKDFNYKWSDNTQVLSSVSRRSPIREKIDLWTSDNFAYSIDNIPVLLDTLKLLELNKNKSKAVKEIGVKYNLKPIELERLINLLTEVGI